MLERSPLNLMPLVLYKVTGDLEEILVTDRLVNDIIRNFLYRELLYTI